MAMSEQTLVDLCAHPYGPLTLKRVRQRFVAQVGGRRAQVALDGATVRVEAGAPVRWPESDGVPADDVDARVRLAMAQIALGRPELVAVEADRGASEVLVRVWIDAERSTVADLAVAVRTALLLGEVAARAVDRIGVALSEERSARERLHAAEEETERAHRVLAAATGGGAVPGVAGDGPPTVTASVAPAGGVPATPVASAPPHSPAPPPSAPSRPPAGSPWAPTHLVPEGGMPAWSSPESSAAPAAQMDGLLEVALLERRGDWAKVLCSNGWSAWVDGRRLRDRG